MRFEMQFRMNNESFGEGAEEAAREVARILRDIADKLENGQPEGKARDSNGNTVGEWGMKS